MLHSKTNNNSSGSNIPQESPRSFGNIANDSGHTLPPPRSRYYTDNVNSTDLSNLLYSEKTIETQKATPEVKVQLKPAAKDSSFTQASE